MTGRKPITYAWRQTEPAALPWGGWSVAVLPVLALRAAPSVSNRGSRRLLTASAPPSVLAARMPLPGGGALSSIPGNGDLLALTLDDGVNTDVVRLYTQFAKDTGVRLTYFVNGRYRSWTETTTCCAAAG